MTEEQFKEYINTQRLDDNVKSIANQWFIECNGKNKDTIAESRDIKKIITSAKRWHGRISAEKKEKAMSNFDTLLVGIKKELNTTDIEKLLYYKEQLNKVISSINGRIENNKENQVNKFKLQIEKLGYNCMIEKK